MVVTMSFNHTSTHSCQLHCTCPSLPGLQKNRPKDPVVLYDGWTAHPPSLLYKCVSRNIQVPCRLQYQKLLGQQGRLAQSCSTRVMSCTVIQWFFASLNLVELICSSQFLVCLIPHTPSLAAPQELGLQEL
jgi:hypothetical protein